jgi:luciferase-like monooxygenase
LTLVLRVAVALPATFDDVGEYLADATALEAAGADTIWLENTAFDPWVLLGGIAAVTHRVGLGCMLASAGALPPSSLGPPVAALHKLSRGRIVVALQDQGKLTEHFAALRAAGARIFTVSTQEKAADGVILHVDSADQLPSKSDSPFEMWAAIATPPDRESWAQVVSSFDAAGASGVIVPWSARLIDLLRNPDPDDRTDLLISTG